MNLLVVPVTGVKFMNQHSCVRSVQWIFYENFSVFGQIIENLWVDEIALQVYIYINAGKLNW